MRSVLFALTVLTISVASAAEKPRVFITESGSNFSGDGNVGEDKAALSFTSGTSPQNIEVMKSFSRHCPEVVVTSKRERADYIIRFDREEPSPVTPFIRGNKVAIFDKNEDLIYSNSTRFTGNAVKGACKAITDSSKH